MVSTNRQVAETLTFMGQILEIQGGDAYKIRAYYRAADLVDRLTVPVAGMSIEELMQIRGIGKALAERIHSIAETGTFQELDDLRADIPKSLLELLKLNGVGPKTINKLWKRLGVQSIDDMEREAKAHRIRAVPGFGERREADILTSIEFYRQQQSGRMPLPIADRVVGAVTAVMEEGSYTVAGSYRRGKSTVGDIDIISTESPQTLNPRLREVADEMINEGERRTSIRIRGQRVDVRFTEQRQFGSMLFYLTGSRDFNIRLREIAIARGWRINEYGIEERQTGKIFEFDNEGKIFEFLGMQNVPPELRENWGEIERALQYALPPLVTLDEIRADLHVHTVMSDGHLTLADVAEIGEARTYECVLVTDHSSSLGVVHGLNADAIARQAQEIERINRNSSCQLLQGIEVDITADGTLGLPNTVLSDLDLVVASVHSGFRQERDVITRRIISAMENEHVDIIGHPTGKLLGERPPYEADLARVFEVAAATETALEVNASPYRLDLDDIFIKQAKEKGVRIAIGSDAHSAPEFAYMRYGVILARRGWCSRDDVVNTRGIKDLIRWSL